MKNVKFERNDMEAARLGNPLLLLQQKETTSYQDIQECILASMYILKR